MIGEGYRKVQKAKIEKKAKRRRPRFRRSDAQYAQEDWEAYERGIRLFNRQKFFEAHEAWEEIWQRAHEVDRRFLQGLIQAAAFLLKVEEGSLEGARRLYERAVDKLKAYRPGYWGLKVDRLMREMAQVRGAGEEGKKPGYPKIELTRNLKETDELR